MQDITKSIEIVPIVAVRLGQARATSFRLRAR